MELWVDPGCPWAWQTVSWLRDLRDQGLFDIRWRLFSLEVNAAPDGDFWDDVRQFGAAHIALLLARREGGDRAFEDLYVSLGRRLHDPKSPMTPDVLASAAAEVGLSGTVERALADPRLPHEVIAEYQAARDRDVFGVPTLSLNGSKAVYGPIIPSAPHGEDALEWWTHVGWLLQRPDFFELKRWPRDIRPGTTPTDDRANM